MFAPYLYRWSLIADGAPILTPMGRLLPVRRGDEALMLKLAGTAEEQRGGAVLEWWGGDGAARVIARHGEALLMERATGTRSLADMARGGQDAAACRILCAAAARLHEERRDPPRDLADMVHWFARSRPSPPRRAAFWRVARRPRGNCWRRHARSPCCMATCTTTMCWISARAAGSPSTRRG